MDGCAVHLPLLFETIQMQAHPGPGHTAQIREATSGCQTSANWTEAEARKAKESNKSIDYRLVYLILFCLRYLN